MSHRHILLVEFESGLPIDAIRYALNALRTERGLHPAGDPMTTVRRESIRAIDTQAFPDTFSVSSILRSSKEQP